MLPLYGIEACNFFCKVSKKADYSAFSPLFFRQLSRPYPLCIRQQRLSAHNLSRLHIYHIEAAGADFFSTPTSSSSMSVYSRSLAIFSASRNFSNSIIFDCFGLYNNTYSGSLLRTFQTNNANNTDNTAAPIQNQLIYVKS